MTPIRRRVQDAGWSLLAAVALLSPSSLTGAFAGVPLQRRADVIVLGVLLPFLVVVQPQFFRATWPKAVCVGLLLWKLATSFFLVQDGLCLQFVTRAPVYRDMGRVPHAWDLRADWRTPTPTCSAIQTRSYASLEEFPVWFFNLPPDSNGLPTAGDRPPEATLDATWSGYMVSDGAGVLMLGFGEDMHPQVSIDGAAIDAAAVQDGLDLTAGVHELAIRSTLSGDRWRLRALWNGADLFESSRAFVSRPSAVDLAIRPAGSLVTSAASLVLLAGWLFSFIRRTGTLPLIGWSAVVTLTAFAAVAIGGDALARWVPLALLLAAFVPVQRRARNLYGVLWLVVIPWLALIVARTMPQVGMHTLYSAGDDWWTFQRFAYRIYLQGYWLEGGETTFWFQPFYRWIAGALHLVFGDSSAGEMIWDGAAIAIGAVFAAFVVKRLLGFRWAVTAAALCLCVFSLGPAWYLIGRGLSELSSAGFIYAAAICAYASRHRSIVALVATGLCATLAFYTRLNNLPMAIATASCAFAVVVSARDLWRFQRWSSTAARATLAGVLGGIFVGLLLFTLRTWYYTGQYNPLHGTQSGSLSVWAPLHDDQSSTALQRLIDSLLMVLTMNDPPRLDVRALPVLIGSVSALLAIAGVPRFRSLPASAVCLCLAGLAGAFIARGNAYPGRFSVHLIPVAVALTFCAAGNLVTLRSTR